MHCISDANIIVNYNMVSLLRGDKKKKKKKTQPNAPRKKEKTTTLNSFINRVVRTVPRSKSRRGTTFYNV